MAELKLFYDLNSSRVRRLKENKWLAEAFIEKMQEIDKKGFDAAIENKNGNYLVGLAGRAGTALKIREKTNNNDGVYVEAVQKIGAGKKGEPWCMYYQQVLIGMAELLIGVVSMFPFSGSCADVRAKAAKIPGLIIDMLKSIFGTVLIKKYKNGAGHTENFDHWLIDGKVAIMNGGNTTEGKLGGEVIREGGGSYETTRDLKDGWIMSINAFPIQTDAPVVKPPKPVSEPGHIPKYGERSDNVATMQRALNKAGVTPKLLEDGKFGPRTKANLSKFQKSKGLPGSGIPGNKTMEFLGLF